MRYEPVYVQDIFLEHPLLYISIFIIGLLLYKLINRRKDKPSGSSTPVNVPKPPFSPGNNLPRPSYPSQNNVTSSHDYKKVAPNRLVFYDPSAAPDLSHQGTAKKVFRADEHTGHTLRGETVGMYLFLAGEKVTVFNGDGRIIGQASVDSAPEGELVLSADGEINWDEAEIVISAPASEADYDTAVVAAMKQKGRGMHVAEFIYDRPRQPELSWHMVIFVDSIDRETGTIQGTSLGASLSQAIDHDKSVFKPDGHRRFRYKRLSQPAGEHVITIIADDVDNVQIGDVLSGATPHDGYTITCERVASWKYRVHYTRVIKQDEDAEPAANDKETAQATTPEAHASLTEKLIPTHDAESASVRLDKALTALRQSTDDETFQALVCAMVKEGLDGRSLYLPTDADNAPLHFEFNQTQVYALYTDQAMAQACADACASDSAAASCIRLPLGQVIETANGNAAIALDLGLPTQAILPPDVVHTIQYLKMVKELGAKEDDPSWAPWFGILNRYLETSHEEDVENFLMGGTARREEVTMQLPVNKDENGSRAVYRLVPEQFGLKRT